MERAESMDGHERGVWLIALGQYHRGPFDFNTMKWAKSEQASVE